MVNFYETRSYWQGGFMEDEQKYYKEYCLSEKGKHVWEQIDRLRFIAGNLCSKYHVSWCFNESGCFRAANHFPFQCTCNDNEMLSSYAKGYYNYYNVERIEEFVAFKGAYKIASFLENVDDAPYKSETFAILKYCMDNYKDDNAILLNILRVYLP